MRVAIVGGGMAGLVLAQGLVARGLAPLVLERSPATVVVPGLIMLPFQAFDPLEDIGLLRPIRATGDAQALSIAIARNPDDADAACRDWEHWRGPALVPYLAMGSAGVRVMRGGPSPSEERWPPEPEGAA